MSQIYKLKDVFNRHGKKVKKIQSRMENLQERI